MEITLWIGLGIIIIGCLVEYIDSTLGMGYGTALTPILLMMGFEPMQVVPAILVAELFTGLLAGVMHAKVGNVEFKVRTLNPKRKYKKQGFSINIHKRHIPSFKNCFVNQSLQRNRRSDRFSCGD